MVAGRGRDAKLGPRFGGLPASRRNRKLLRVHDHGRVAGLSSLRARADVHRPSQGVSTIREPAGN
jgi:hypothetical protein